MADENNQQAPLGSDVGPEVNRVVAEAPAVEEPKTERPEGLPEGFDTWEAFGKAQLDAQQKEAPKEPAEDAPKDEGAPELSPELKAELDKLPETVRDKAAPLFQEFETTGTLTPESRKAAAEAFGVTEEMVDVYVAGYGAKTEEVAQPFYEAAGGKEVFNEFRAWAEAGGLTPEEQAEFNARLDKGPEEAKKVIAEAIDLWKAEGNGKPPRDITRDQPSKDASADTGGFTDKDQMLQAMRDPRYSKDASYRAGVDAKIAKSPF